MNRLAQPSRKPTSKPIRLARSTEHGAIIAAVSTAAVLALIGCSGSPQVPSPAPAATADTSWFGHSEKKMPRNGTVKWLSPTGKWGRTLEKQNIANGYYGQLRISAPAGGTTFYVKLVANEELGADTLGVVIAPGRTVTIKVPLHTVWDLRYHYDDLTYLPCKSGTVHPKHPDVRCVTSSSTYHLHFGAGTDWYGYDYLFGPAGSYKRANRVFTFSQGKVWSVELALRPGGNLGSADIPYDKFIE